MVMKIEFDLNLVEIDDGYWSTTITEIIQNEVESEVRKFVKKQVKSELVKSEKMIKKYVSDMTGVKIKKALDELKI
jgi:hypothetical protein